MADGMVIVPSTTLPLTPCTGVCRLDARGLCEGCLRTGDEIARWSTMDDVQKLWIMDEVLPHRQPG
jgi:predicted Fe-S protein YdhL (DUF1289 family)